MDARTPQRRAGRIIRLHVTIGLAVGLCAALVLGALVTVAVRWDGAATTRAARVEAAAIASASARPLARAATGRPSILARRLRAMRRANPRLAGVAVHTAGAPESSPLAEAGALSRDALAADRRVAALRTGRAVVRSRERDGGTVVLLSTALPRRGDASRSVLSLALRAPRSGASSAWLVALGGAASLLLGGLAALMVARRAGRPLRALSDHAERMARESGSVGLGWVRGDEVGVLAGSIDRLAGALAERLQGLQALAMIDPLTGLANNRAIGERLQAELGRARREVYRVAVVVLDIDHFKGVNDTFGHAVGDEALRLLATTLQEHLRPGDLCGRNGGDEFVLALAGADGEAARGVIDRIRRGLAAKELGSTDQRLTISAGASEFPLHGWTQDELLALADRALYVSKAEGRERFTVYRADESTALADLPPDDVARRHATIRSVRALVQAVDAKDGYTLGHSQRVASHAAQLASAAGLEPARVEMVRTAGVLHDVGKIGVDTPLLGKMGMMSERELGLVRRHSELGREIVAAAGLSEPANWIRHVHERWDGLGYPDGLSGADVPLESRILHVAEALDSMTHPPHHRSPRSEEWVLRELELGAGGQFDPELVTLMIDLVRDGSVQARPGAAVPDAFRDLAVPVTPRRPTLPVLLTPPLS